MGLRSQFVLLVILFISLVKNSYEAPQGNDLIEAPNPIEDKTSFDLAPQANDAIEVVPNPAEENDVEVLKSLRDSFAKLQESLQPDLNELIIRIGTKFQELKDPALKVWKYVETQIAPLLGSFYQLIAKVENVGLKQEFEDLFLKAHKQFSSLITEVEKLPKSNFSDVVHAFTTVPVMLTMLANWREFPAKIMSSILKYLFEHMEVQQ